MSRPLTETTISYIPLLQTRSIPIFLLETIPSLGSSVVWDPISNLESALADFKPDRSFRLNIDMTTIYQKVNAPITTLASPLGVGSVVRFFSTKIDKSGGRASESTAVSLHKGSRILVTASIRFSQGIILFNTQTEDGAWGTDQTVPIAGLFKDDGAVVGFRSNETSYTVSVEGSDIYIYNKRVEADVDGVSYTVSPGATPPLSDPVAVFISTA